MRPNKPNTHTLDDLVYQDGVPFAVTLVSAFSCVVEVAPSEARYFAPIRWVFFVCSEKSVVELEVEKIKREREGDNGEAERERLTYLRRRGRETR